MNKIFDRLFYKYISLLRLLFLRHEKFETKKEKKNKILVIWIFKAWI